MCCATCKIKEKDASNMNSNVDWNICPTEIWIYIFNFLDVKSLYNCMYVNSKWKAIALTVVSVKDLWDNLVNKQILNGGKAIIRKSNFDYRGICMRVLQWHDVKNSDLNHVHQYKFYSAVKHFYIYKGLLVVLTNGMLKRFYIETFQFVEESTCNSVKFEESDDLLVYVFSNNDIQFTTRWLTIPPKSFKRHVSSYKLEDNELYIISKNVFTKAVTILLEWQFHFCRFYGSVPIVSTTVYEHEVHVLTSDGRTFRSCFEKSCLNTYRCASTLQPRTMTMKFYGIVSNEVQVIVGDTIGDEFRYCYDETLKTIFIESPDLSCVIQHGEVFLIGSSSGRIDIVIPTNLLINGGVPEKSFFVEGNEAVTGLDVYESTDAHVLFAQTDCSIHQYNINIY